MISFVIFTRVGYSQNIPNFFFRENLYEENIRKSIKNSLKLGSYRIITPGYFDLDNDNVIEFELLERTLNNWYPQKSHVGYLVIDWEKDYFKDLKKFSASDKRFICAKNGFYGLIKAIRKLRPNLKLGIYGIPYRYNYEFQKTDNTKFEIFLREADFIAPSLYLSFPEEENAEKNIKFLEDNLTAALILGKKINRPVIPFMWYMYSGAFSKTKGRYITKESMKRHTTFVRTFSVGGIKVKSIFWWDQSDKSFNGLKNRNTNQLGVILKTQSDVFNYYKEVFNI